MMASFCRTTLHNTLLPLRQPERLSEHRSGLIEMVALTVAESVLLLRCTAIVIRALIYMRVHAALALQKTLKIKK